MKKLLKRIDDSLYDSMGKVSHTKISSYVILLGIYVSALMFLVIDIVNAAVTWSKAETYEIPGAHIGLFTLLLGHHLALLGIKKYSENKNVKENTNKMNGSHGADSLPDVPGNFGGGAVEGGDMNEEEML